MSTPAHRERLMQVLLGPHVSEKATSLAESSQVVFKVRSDATKTDIRQAVELLFEVKVERVAVVRVPVLSYPRIRITVRESSPAEFTVSKTIQINVIDFP